MRALSEPPFGPAVRWNAAPLSTHPEATAPGTKVVWCKRVAGDAHHPEPVIATVVTDDQDQGQVRIRLMLNEQEVWVPRSQVLRGFGRATTRPAANRRAG